MRLDLTSPHDQSIKAEIVISDTTGEAVLDRVHSGPVDAGDEVATDLADAIAEANDSRHAGVPAWAPAREYLTDWALARGIHVAEFDVPEWESDPEVVY